MTARWIAFAVTFASASAAFAGPSATPLPEPGSLALLGAGAVAGIVIVVRKRRK
jgi:hypothetical protein